MYMYMYIYIYIYIYICTHIMITGAGVEPCGPYRQTARQPASWPGGGTAPCSARSLAQISTKATNNTCSRKANKYGGLLAFCSPECAKRRRRKRSGRRGRPIKS